MLNEEKAENDSYTGNNYYFFNLVYVNSVHPNIQCEDIQDLYTVCSYLKCESDMIIVGFESGIQKLNRFYSDQVNWRNCPGLEQCCHIIKSGWVGVLLNDCSEMLQDHEV